MPPRVLENRGVEDVFYLVCDGLSDVLQTVDSLMNKPPC